MTKQDLFNSSGTTVLLEYMYLMKDYDYWLKKDPRLTGV
jgi:hypothetical protein